MIIQFEMYKFWKAYKQPRGAVTYGSFLESMRTDAKYGTEVYQFICQSRRQHVKELVCLRQTS